MSTSMLRIPGYLTVDEAAALIGCTKNWVHKLLREGELKGDRVSERRIFVKKSSAEKYAKMPKIMGRPRISAMA